MPHRRTATLGLAAALTLSGAALSGATASAAGSAGGGLAVLQGATPETRLFPTDRFTVADTAQQSGRRVALPMPACTDATRSVCDATRLLDQLDGFDLQPRVSIPFTAAVDIASVGPTTVYVTGPNGFRTPLLQLVADPATHVVEGTVADQLAEDTRYTIHVTTGVHTRSGAHLARPVTASFTTETATGELDKIRRSLDSGAAYQQAGITDRGLSFAQAGLTTVFTGASVAKEGITRNDQVSADPSVPLSSSMVPDLVAPGSIGAYAFGSFASPQFVTPDAVIPQVPTRQTPPALSAARLGFAMIVPAGPAPAGGWPVAVYGPGFTRSYFDLFVTADHNASLGIATVATDPLGHGYGPASTITVTHAVTPDHPSTSDTFLSYGRGRAVDGTPAITADSGVQPSDTKTVVGGQVVSDAPSPYAGVGLRDGLLQTAADNMALVRAIEHGVSVPTATGAVALSPTAVQYYGLSFGAIYGTMLMGTDPDVRDGFLNSGGGPILDIARNGGFRSTLAAQLAVLRPNLLNGGPGLNGFTESLPGRTDAPITNPAPGSAALRQFLAYGNWLERAGSPESFAPLLRLHPRYGPKTVEFLNAFGDHTVPNSTTGTVLRAGQLFDRFTYYRNDMTPTSGTDPHGFLADPTLAGRSMGEAQLGAFLSSHGQNVIDPDGPGPIFETPIVDPTNTECLHYAEPQSGGQAFPPGASGGCGPVRY